MPGIRAAPPAPPARHRRPPAMSRAGAIGAALVATSFLFPRAHAPMALVAAQSPAAGR